MIIVITIIPYNDGISLNVREKGAETEVLIEGLNNSRFFIRQWSLCLHF